MFSDVLLRDRILRLCRIIEKHLEARTMADMVTDTHLKDLVVKRLEGIGTAAYGLSRGFKAEHGGVDWDSIVNLGEITPDTPVYEIWVAASMTVPEVLAQLEKIR